MKEFLHSKKLKILIVLLVFLFAFMLRAVWTGGSATLLSQAVSLVTTPLQKASAAVSRFVDEKLGSHLRIDEILAENEQLKAENQQLTEQLVDYERVLLENEHYQEFLGIKEENPDFDFTSAMVIGRDPGSRFGSFTIDQGTLGGVALHDPVITAEGLVGMVTEVGANYAKVTTILDVASSVGAYDARTRDTGILTGDVALAEEGLCKLTYLEKTSGVTAGDLIVTSGEGGIYPKELVLGEVLEVGQESHGISLYAVVRPAVDLGQVKDVLVITSFYGQAGEAENE